MAKSERMNINHRIKLFPQPTNMTCWSAATTMLFGSVYSAGPGRAVLGDTGGVKTDPDNIKLFASSNGLKLYWPQSWTVEGLAELLQRGPVVLAGPIPKMHAIVIGGITGDGTPAGTDLTIYDPSPTNIGAKKHMTYQALMTQFPMSTWYLLQR